MARPNATNSYLLEPDVVHGGAWEAVTTDRARVRQGRWANGIISSRSAVDSCEPRTLEGGSTVS